MRTPAGRGRGSGVEALVAGKRIRTSDLRVMSPTSCRCSTPRPTTLALAARSVKRTAAWRTFRFRRGGSARTERSAPGTSRCRRPRPADRRLARARPPTSSPMTRRHEHDGREHPERQPDVDLGEVARRRARRRRTRRPGRAEDALGRRRAAGRAAGGDDRVEGRAEDREPVASTRMSGTASSGSGRSCTGRRRSRPRARPPMTNEPDDPAAVDAPAEVRRQQQDRQPEHRERQADQVEPGAERVEEQAPDDLVRPARAKFRRR